MGVPAPATPHADGSATATTVPARLRRPRADPARPAWAEYLIDLRMARGITQAQAADLMGVRQQTWTGMESGYRTRGGTVAAVVPMETTLLRVASVLDLTAQERQHLQDLVGARPTGAPVREWQVRLRRARLGAGMTTAKAARAAGVSRSAYQSWERKKEGGVCHQALTALLGHFGLDPAATAAILADVPAEGTPARAPRQATKPAHEIPAWSRFLTSKRLAAGLHLAHVDALVGQQSAVRRFELGGWPRKDGRCSVPSRTWLERIADALALTAQDRASLHVLADNQRLVVAAAGPGPLAAEILAEARRAADLRVGAMETLLPSLPCRWTDYERGAPAALASLGDQPVFDAVVAALAMGPLLTSALSAQMRATGPTGPVAPDLTAAAHP